MKALFFFLVIAFPFVSSSQENNVLRKINNNAFKVGEKLTYRAYYSSLLTGNVTAGELVLNISNSDELYKRKVMRIVANGYTKGFFNAFFKVKDRYETYLDEEAIVPWIFIRRVNEGGYIIEQDVFFNHFNNTMLYKDLKRNKTNKSKIPPYIQDILSAIYYFRTYDFNKLKVGEGIPIQFTLDDTVYTTKVFYLGKETIKTSLGWIDCIKIKPMVLTGNVFKEPFPMIVWASDDENKVPILASSQILVGSVKMELIHYEGLIRPLKFYSKKPK